MFENKEKKKGKKRVKRGQVQKKNIQEREEEKNGSSRQVKNNNGKEILLDWAQPTQE